MTDRRGFTLTELLVGMVLMGIVGVALTKLFVSQSRFYDRETQMRRARFVTRTAINAAVSDLRMVEATGGVVSATPRVNDPQVSALVVASSASASERKTMPSRCAMATTFSTPTCSSSHTK